LSKKRKTRNERPTTSKSGQNATAQRSEAQQQSYPIFTRLLPIAIFVVLAFALWVRSLRESAHPVIATKWSLILRAKFVGSADCATCHERENSLWRGSHHQLAMQAATNSTVLDDFNNASFNNYEITSTFSRRYSKFIVRTDGPDGALHDYEIKYTFGVSPLQQYLIIMPGGRLRELGIA
jgi:hypothetical protein